MGAITERMTGQVSTGRVSELRIETGIIGGRAATRLLIDGTDVLELQRPTHRRDGSPYSRPKVFLPADPRDLLPPDSSALLPAAIPREAMVGVCGCGESGCGSLWMQVRREGNLVFWEPDPLTVRSSIDTTWSFELRQYLDAVDEGAASLDGWQTRPWQIAREMRRRRDSFDGLGVVCNVFTGRVQVVDARAYPGHDSVTVYTTTDDGDEAHEIPVTPTTSDEEFLAALYRIPIQGRRPRPDR